MIEASSQAGLGHATCFRHADRPAEIACSRCGTFCCSTCHEKVGELRYCPDCFERQVLALPSLAPRQMWARLGLRLVALVYALEVSATFALLRGAMAWNTTQAILVENGVFTVLFIATAVMFCRWFHLAVATAASRGEPVGSPGFAVASWFIPGLNFFRPFATVRRMLLNPDIAARGRVLAWQVTWVVGLVSIVPETMVGAAVQSHGFASAPELSWMPTIALILVQARRGVMLSSALLAAAVVNRVTRGFALSQD